METPKIINTLDEFIEELKRRATIGSPIEIFMGVPYADPPTGQQMIDVLNTQSNTIRSRPFKTPPPTNEEA